MNENLLVLIGISAWALKEIYSLFKSKGDGLKDDLKKFSEDLLKATVQVVRLEVKLEEMQKSLNLIHKLARDVDSAWERIRALESQGRKLDTQ